VAVAPLEEPNSWKGKNVGPIEDRPERECAVFARSNKENIYVIENCEMECSQLYQRGDGLFVSFDAYQSVWAEVVISLAFVIG
jgi:hypothetical protein